MSEHDADSTDATDGSLAASLRTLGYAEFALLRPVALAEIALAREVESMSHLFATVPVAAAAVGAVIVEPVGELHSVAQTDVATQTDSVAQTDPATQLEEASDPDGDAGDEPEAEVIALDASAVDGQRDGRSGRALLEDIRFLDE